MRMLQSTHLSMSKEQSIQPHPFELLQQVLKKVQLLFEFLHGHRHRHGHIYMDMDTSGMPRIRFCIGRDPMIYREGNVIAMLIPMGLGFQGSGHMLHGKSGTYP